jgi:hypothetical protein
MMKLKENGQYTTADETAALVQISTPDEKWVTSQLDRIAPERYEMGAAGDVPALIKLVLELRDEKTRLQGEAGVMRGLLEKSLDVLDTICETDDLQWALRQALKTYIAELIEKQRYQLRAPQVYR